MPLLAALHFLTVVPLPGRAPSAQDMAESAGYFPVVGLLIGVFLAGCDAILAVFVPDGVIAALLIVLLITITGGLHLDGLADTCDGFFNGGASPQRRLEIMRDSHVGSYGVTGIVALLLVQYAGIAGLSPSIRATALVAMATLSRWAMSFAVLSFPYGREQGLGSAFRPRSPARSLFFATAFALAVCLLLLNIAGAALLSIVWLTTWLVGRLLLHRLPGLTGDTYGAINEVVQSVVLVLLVTFDWS